MGIFEKEFAKWTKEIIYDILLPPSSFIEWALIIIYFSLINIDLISTLRIIIHGDIQNHLSIYLQIKKWS